MDNAKLVILLVEDEDELRELIGFVVESQFNATVLYARSGNEAIQIIKQGQSKIDLIVCDYNMPDGNGADLNLFLYKEKLTTPLVLCSSDTPEQHPELSIRPISGFAEKPFFEKPLVREIGRILRSNLTHAKEEVSFTFEQMIKVRVSLLKLANVMPCDVMIKLSDTKFVKIYNQEDVFSESDYKKWQEKKTDFLYLHKAHLDTFFNKLMHAYQSSLSSRVTAAVPPDHVSLSLAIQDSIHDIGSKLGFTKELEAMTKFTISQTLATVEKNPALSEILKQINNRSNYISSHSLACSFVCSWLSNRMEWYSDQTITKLIMASLLHDITISDPEIAKVQDESEFFDSNTKFLESGYSQWKEHPIKAAQLAAQFTEVPPDVNTIIAQHHERPHGGGFPHGLSHSKISPMAALFIIAHDLTNFLMVPESTVSEFLEKRTSVYDVGYFKRILKRIPETGIG